MNRQELTELCNKAQLYLTQPGALGNLLRRMELNANPTNKGGFVLECPIHRSQSGNGDLSIYRQPDSPIYWAWACKSQSCHKLHGLDIVSFVHRAANLPSREAAAKYILEPYAGKSPPTPAPVVKRASRPLPEPIRFDPSETWAKRGVYLDTLIRFKVTDEVHYTKVPVHFPDGQLAGYALRIKYPQCPIEGCGKYHPESGACVHMPKHKTPDFEKGKCLFNWHRVQPFLKVNPTIVVVESILDCLLIEQTGLHRCVALMGSAVTDHHLDLLRAVPNIVVATDNDDAGDAVYEQLCCDLPDHGRIERFNVCTKYFAKTADRGDPENFAKDIAEATHIRPQLATFGIDHQIWLYQC